MAIEVKEWAPKDKEDEKFQKKQQDKVNQMNYTGPSKADLKKQMEEEDELLCGKKKNNKSVHGVGKSEASLIIDRLGLCKKLPEIID